MNYSSSKKSWSPEEENEMLVSIQKGESFEKIAQRHERTPNAIKLRFGMVCKKEIENTKHTIEDICRQYNTHQKLVLKCIDDFENIQKKNQNQNTAGHSSAQNISAFDLADISIIKEEILVINEKLDKIYRNLKKLMETKKKKNMEEQPQQPPQSHTTPVVKIKNKYRNLSK